MGSGREAWCVAAARSACGGSPARRRAGLKIGRAGSSERARAAAGETILLRSRGAAPLRGGRHALGTHGSAAHAPCPSGSVKVQPAGGCLDKRSTDLWNDLFHCWVRQASLTNNEDVNS